MPNSPYSRLAYLKRRAHTLRAGLNQRLEEIYFSDFPIPSPQTIIKLLQDILAKTEVEIEKSTDDKSIVLICNLIQHIGLWLEYLDNAHTEQTPRGLVALLEWLLKQLQPNSQLLVWPQSGYNYTIRDLLEPIRYLLENFLPAADRAALLAPFQGPINLVSFPRIERDDILLHAVFGHEIGHPIAAEFLASEQADPNYQQQLAEANQKLVQYAKEKLAHPQTAFDTLKLHQHLLQALLQFRSRALQEIISDYVAILCFGPNALFALHDVFLTGQLDALPAPPEFYPPQRMRLRIARKAIEDEGHWAVLQSLAANPDVGTTIASAIELLNEIAAIAAQTHDLDAIKNDEFIIGIVYGWVEQAIPAAFAFAKAKIGAVAYSPKVAGEELLELLAKLRIGVPPNEIGDAKNPRIVDSRSAILAGWLYKIHGEKQTAEGPKPLTSEDIDQLQRLTLRAVEFVMLQRRYRTQVLKQPT